MNLQIIRHLVARITRWYLAIDLRYSFHVICVEVRIATKLIYLFECSTNCGRHKKRNSSLVDLYLSILDQSITVLVFAKMVEHWKKYEKKAEMGSFTSTHTFDNGDHQDSDIELPQSMESQALLAIFQEEASGNLQFERVLLRLTTKETCSDIRIMQWNVLSQTIGQHYDKFVLAPREALEWKSRRFQILQEILTYMPDVMCLQEVDHFEFLNKTLSTQGYQGLFFPKPDSPCLYVKDNNGPDGCAIFFRKSKFEMLKSKKLVLPVWTISSNQVAITLLLKDIWTGKMLCVATTHLKARPGALMSTIRKEQGKALLDFVQSNSAGCPMIICGDFNAEPNEPVYELLSNSLLNLGSAYAYTGEEPEYTSWKVREDGEQRQTLDYIFYSKNNLEVDSVLTFPSGCEIGETRLPSLIYPSDHLSLVCDLSFK